jgi:peptidylprolyl isomerase
MAAFASAEAPDVTDKSNWRAVDAANIFVFDTSKGRVVIEAFPDMAPNHVVHFRKLIRDGMLDGTPFHRVIDDFMAQGGDVEAVRELAEPVPTINGEFTIKRDPLEMVFQVFGEPDSGRSGYYLGAPVGTQSAFLAEMSAEGTVESWIIHCPGVVSTARTSDPNSASSQFFLMRQTANHLDRGYTAWGRVIEGLSVVRALKAGPDGANGSVENPDVLVKAVVAQDQPAAQRVKAWVQRTDGPDFAATLAAQPISADVCELPPVPAVVKTGN